MVRGEIARVGCGRMSKVDSQSRPQPRRAWGQWSPREPWRCSWAEYGVGVGAVREWAARDVGGWGRGLIPRDVVRGKTGYALQWVQVKHGQAGRTVRRVGVGSRRKGRGRCVGVCGKQQPLWFQEGSKERARARAIAELAVRMRNLQ